jgi:hypothetical protein
MPLLHPSGGLVYHWRAWRWRRTLWAPFHDQVRRWLTDWRPGEKHLVLVGPSGGYALSSQFLERFPRITVLEPDALARRILARRFPEQRFAWRSGELLARPGGFAWLAATYPDAAFLFCNLLGQSPVGAEAGFDRRVWLEDWQSALAVRAWASWHDLASTSRPPDRAGVLALSQGQPHDDVLAHFWLGGELEIHDHECAGLFPALPRQCVVWRLTPKHYQLIEWISGRGGDAPAGGVG